MHHPSRTLFAAALALFAVSLLPAQNGTLYGIGDLSGGISWSQVRDVTKTGGVIYAVGSSAANAGSTTGDTAVLWTSIGGLTAIPNLDTSNTTSTSFVTASDITPDAAYIAARSILNPSGNLRQAVRVTTSGLTVTNLLNPGGFTPYSFAASISDDGSVAYGVSSNGSGNLQATRFVSGVGADAIDFASVGDISSIPTGRAVSGNGNLMLGTSANNTNVGGPGARAFIYNYNGGSPSVSLLPLLTGGTWSQSLAMNSAGNLMLLGGDTVAHPNGELYLTNGATVTAALGTPNATLGINALGGMNSDGSIVGMSWTGTTNDSYIYNNNGWQGLTGIALASGANLTGWSELGLSGISEDGTLVWGDGLHNGNSEGYVLEFAPGYLATATAIPEPSTYAAFAGLGALGLAAWRRRRATTA